jgi:hypothetical protein
MHEVRRNQGPEFPVQELDAIGLRLSSTDDEVAGAIDTKWEIIERSLYLYYINKHG